MWIIIEGPTCAGKSTMESLILRRLEDPALRKQVERVHMGRPDELSRRWALKEYAINWESRDVKRGHVLADRWHWGEPVYGPIYRPETNKDGFGLLGVAGWRWTELFLLSRGAVTAYLHANDETLIQRLHERGDDHVRNEDELLQVAKLYGDTWGYAPTVAGRLDTTNSSNPDDFARQIIAAAGRAEQRAVRVAPWPGYIGSPRPRALLVGDTRNITEQYGEETVLPFMPVNGNSGDYLLRSLPEQFWPHVGIVNGTEIEDLELLWHVLHRPPVVALGRRAERAVRKASIKEFAVMPHPQYARRFKSKQIESYGRSIQTAAETGKAEVEWTLSGR